VAVGVGADPAPQRDVAVADAERQAPEQFRHSNGTPVFLPMDFHDGFAWRTNARTGSPT
jgi:hypothetical protein